MSILQQKMQQPGQQAPEQKQPEGSGQNGNQATQSEQEAYEKVVTAGMTVLYEDQTHEKVLQMLQTGKKNPAKALADVSTMIVTQLDEQSGNTIPEEVILPATQEILEMVAELAEKANVFEVNEQVAGESLQQTLIQVADAYGVAEEDAQELLASMSEDDLNKTVQQQSMYDRSGAQNA